MYNICSGIDSVPEPVQASGPIQKLGSGLQFQPGFARKKMDIKYAAFSFLLKSEKKKKERHTKKHPRLLRKNDSDGGVAMKEDVALR